MLKPSLSHGDFSDVFDQGELTEFADGLIDGWGAFAGFSPAFFQELNQMREEGIAVTGQYDAQLTEDDLIYVNVELEEVPMNFF